MDGTLRPLTDGGVAFSNHGRVRLAGVFGLSSPRREINQSGPASLLALALAYGPSAEQRTRIEHNSGALLRQPQILQKYIFVRSRTVRVWVAAASASGERPPSIHTNAARYRMVLVCDRGLLENLTLVRVDWLVETHAVIFASIAQRMHASFPADEFETAFHCGAQRMSSSWPLLGQTRSCDSCCSDGKLGLAGTFDGFPQVDDWCFHRARCDELE